MNVPFNPLFIEAVKLSVNVFKAWSFTFNPLFIETSVSPEISCHLCTSFFLSILFSSRRLLRLSSCFQPLPFNPLFIEILLKPEDMTDEDIDFQSSFHRVVAPKGSIIFKRIKLSILFSSRDAFASDDVKETIAPFNPLFIES